MNIFKKKYIYIISKQKKLNYKTNKNLKINFKILSLV